MLKAYTEYYRQPSLQNAKKLWEQILNYDYKEPLDELASLRSSISPRLQLSDCFLSSNGSIDGVRQYTFGPHTKFWLRQIEDCTKYRLTSKYVLLNTSFKTRNTEFIFKKVPLSEVSDDAVYYVGSIQLQLPGAIEFLINKLQRIGKHTIYTFPNNWLYLLSRPEFREYLSNSQTSGMSTNWEGFYPTPPTDIHFNDNMVNWTTGMNFYTCPHGTKHFLPLFVPTPEGIVNLINLTRPALWPVDDLMIISPETKQCPCGRPFREFEYTPHINKSVVSSNGKIIYDLSLANRLKSSYLSLQFIQYGKVVHVLYIADRGLDKEIIKEYFGEHGLKTKFIRDRYLELNDKFPVFWGVDKPFSTRRFTPS
jgi:hypothetical protein